MKPTPDCATNAGPSSEGKECATAPLEKAAEVVADAMASQASVATAAEGAAPSSRTVGLQHPAPEIVLGTEHQLSESRLQTVATGGSGSAGQGFDGAGQSVDGAGVAVASVQPSLDVAEPPASPKPQAHLRLASRVPAIAGRLGRLGLWAFASYLALVLVLVVAYRFVNPPMSLLMLTQRLGGTKITQNWVPLSAISPNLMRAVVVSEDGRFCSHWGVDLGEFKAALERARDGIPRGASTLTMQVAKNLFLSPINAYLRKVIELPLAVVIELLWPKKRIFEVYANIAEWGPGIFGAEAGSLYHFDKPAARLSEREAALLAVSLPNPITRDAGSPGPGTIRLADRIQMRMRAMPRATACLDRRQLW